MTIRRRDAVDHWLDEALRAVPLPDGFFARMSTLADSAPELRMIGIMTVVSRSDARLRYVAATERPRADSPR